MRNLDWRHIGVIEVDSDLNFKLSPSDLLDFVRWTNDFLVKG